MSETFSRNDFAEALVREYVRTRRGDLRDRIVQLYTDMVERIARRYAGLEPHEDLVQAGYLGLLNALSLFEPSKGVRFNTYATHLVAGAIKHHLRDRGKIIREPAWLQEVRHRVNRAAGRLQQQLVRSPTQEEIAEETSLPVETVREVMSTDELFRVASLTVGSGQDDDGESEEVDLADDCREQLGVEERVLLDTVMQGLRDLERKVLHLFHFESLNQTEIAGQLGISGNYVSHILRQSLAKLRGILDDEERRDRILQRQASAIGDFVLDDTTQAYTETYLMARLNEECARAACDDSCVAFIHVEFRGLEALERFYGPDAVDDFLTDAAGYLKNSVRRLDAVGRMRQTGFGIVLPGTGKTVKAVHDRLAKRLQTWLAQESVSRTGVSVLVGAAYYPDAGRNANRLTEAIELLPLEPPKAA
ncbi:MAG: sigma-70 family RNA polymerase sigma factor [Armatimonadetes bacterium]|nr:sigma-70 family RNA polymerase sigma factor [Armatimonadota bacterium]